jgi:hypothetical protein
MEFLTHRKHCISITKTKRLMLFKEIIFVYSENHTKRINTVSDRIAEMLNALAAGIYSYDFDLKDKIVVWESSTCVQSGI